jgi:hypothetical protein
MLKESSYPFPQDIVEKTDIELGHFAKIKEFSSNPDYIVKDLGPKTLDVFKEDIGHEENLLKNSKSGIYELIPKHMLVYGTDDALMEKGFIVMEKVTGKDIETIQKFTPEMVSQLESLVATSLKFYEETKLDKNQFFPDIWKSARELNNIMYGKTKSDEQDRMYLVDTYPLMRATYSPERHFDMLKCALAEFSKRHQVEFSSEFRSTLLPYGTIAFEPYVNRAYTVEDAQV